MSFFDKITDAILGPKERDKRYAPKPAPSPVTPTKPAATTARPSATPAAAPQPAAPQPTTVVNVENSLDSMPGAELSV